MGDIESAPFIEAMRQFQFRVGYDNFALIHVSLVPDMHGEQKTKPTQTTVHSLRGLGLLPDLVCSYSMMRIKFSTFFICFFGDSERLLAASSLLNRSMLQQKQK